MPRRARVVFPGVPHHVTQRGNRRGQVFFARSDGAEYLRLLREQARRHAIEVVAYCLMPNHVHLVLVPTSADGLHRALKVIHGRFALRINRMRNHEGHLWQDRYFSSPLDSSYFFNAVRYVELNPVRAGLVESAENYEWSSAAAHCEHRRDFVVSARPQSALFGSITDWSNWLRSGLSRESLAVLRRNSTQNLPCGSSDFIAKLESHSKQLLQYRPRGRPQKLVEKKEDAPFHVKGERPLFEKGDGCR
jgi:putative transposase